jgi:FkbM family methyltransferase
MMTPTTCQVRLLDDDDSLLSLRPESWDWGIARSVALDNEYRLPDRFDKHDIILDIGAHIGAFSLACLRRGAGRVIAFEPDSENAALAAKNLAAYGDRFQLHVAAIWRSDQDINRLRLRQARHPLNTGGHDVLSDDEQEALPSVTAISLDKVLAALPSSARLMKIDCEGAEYPILLTATRLHRVTEIVGEFHRFGLTSEHGPVTARMRVDGVEHYDEASLSRYLEKQGYTVELPRPATSISAKDHGLFFARRT